MKKQLCFTVLLILSVLLSVSVACASDINVTDSYATSLVDDTKDVSISNRNVAGSSEILASAVSNVDNDTSEVSLSSEEVLGSDTSNTLSTNTNSNSAEGVTNYIAYSDDAVLSASSGIAVSESASQDLTIDDNVKLAAPLEEDKNADNTILAKSSDSILSTVYTGGNLIATLTDSEGNPISGAKVGFANNGVTYIRTDKNGKASYSTKDLNAGTYTVKVKFYGDNIYSASNQAIAKITVSKSNTKLTSSNVNVNYGSNGYLVATLKDSNGNPVSGAKVGFANNGVKYVLTDANGQAKYSTKDLAPGTYNVKMKFYGNDAYLESNQIAAQITVNNVATKLAVVNSGSDGLVATLTDANGKPVSGAKVGFANNGVKYIVTDANGQAKYSTSGLTKGTYTVKMKFYGNDAYPASNQVVAQITVNKYITTLTSTNLNANYGSNAYLTATLRDSNGKPVSGAKVGFANNGVKYVVTDANGQAKYSIDGLAAGNYTVKMKFYGNDNYLESNQAVATISINKVATTLTSANVKVTYGSSGNLVATLKDAYGNPIKGAKVGFTYNGLKYAVTDANGQAKYSIDGLAAGTYTVKMKFYGSDSYLESDQISATVTVTQKSDSGSSSTNPATVSINDILAGADTLKNYYSKNNKFPTTVTVAGHAFTLPEFLYLMNQAINQLGSSNNAAIKCIYGVKAPSSPSGDAINTQLYKSNYLAVAKNVVSYIQTNNNAPNYATSTAGKIMYSDLLDISSRILAFYKNNDKTMPNYVTINTKGGSSSSSDSSSSSSSNSSSGSTSKGPATIAIKDILTGAVNLKNYYSNNGALPKTVTAAGHAFTLSEFLYLMAQATYQIGNSNTSAIKCIYGVKDASSTTADSINAQLVKKDYLTLANNLATYIKKNNQAPNYASSAVGKINYNVLVDAFSRILAFYKNNDNYMPNYVTVIQGSQSSSSSYTIGGMNVRNTITNLDPYYKSTTNCQVNNAAIKNVVNSLTAGLTSDKEKATVIYNYVRDQISYSFYYDTRYGAAGTLNARTGNCVDQAHLLVAMYRTAGLAARYEHGTCYFTLSGSTYGHVWTQVLIDNVWVVGDPTSNRNSFGNVVNWNTNSYTHKAYYASLPF